MDSLELKRKRELEKELNRILDIFISQYRPSKIILFGSLANGIIRETTDIDLLIIKDTPERYWERIDEVLHLSHPEEAVDIFVLTNKEIEDNLTAGNNYLKEILESGRILYEARDS